MPNVSEKKKKLLCLLKIFVEQTDAGHTMTLPQLLDELEAMGVPAERKSVYDDIETLRSMGLEIETRKSKTFQYYLEKRRFSFPELQALAGLIRREPSFTAKQKRVLLEKLTTLCSVHQAPLLLKSSEDAPREDPETPREKITLEFPAGLLEVLEKKFDCELSTEPAGKNRLRAVLQAETGPEFFAWLFLQGTEVKLLSPKKLAEKFRERAKAVSKLYKS